MSGKNAASDTLIAVVLTFFGSFLSSLSLVLMKYAHNRVQESGKKSAVLDPFWISGFVSLIAGSALNVVALGYGNQLLLASTSSLSIIFNTLFSVFLLKEPLRRWDLISIMLICVGSILFLLVAKNDEVNYSEKQLLDLYLRPISLLFITLSIAFIVAVYWHFMIYKKQLLQLFKDSDKDGEEEPVSKNILDAVNALNESVFAKIYNGKYRWLKSQLKIPMTLMSIVAGLVGGLQSSFMRGMTISFQVQGFFDFATIGYLLLAGVIAVLQLVSLNKAMEMYEQIEVVPIYQSSLILLNILCGGIILNEEAMYQWYELLELIACSLICILGIVLIVKHPPTDETQEEEKANSNLNDTEETDPTS